MPYAIAKLVDQRQGVRRGYHHGCLGAKGAGMRRVSGRQSRGKAGSESKKLVKCLREGTKCQIADGRLHGLSHGLLATWPAKRSCNKTPGLERSHRFLSENSCRAGGKLRSAQSCGDNTIATEENRRRGIRSTKMTTLSPPGNRTGAVYRVRTRSHTHRLPMSTKK